MSRRPLSEVLAANTGPHPLPRIETPMSKVIAAPAAVAFLACILLANYVTTEYGMVPVGFGLIATAGTYFAGLTFVLRDSLQDAAGKWADLSVVREIELLSVETTWRTAGLEVSCSTSPTLAGQP